MASLVVGVRSAELAVDGHGKDVVCSRGYRGTGVPDGRGGVE